MPFEISTPKNTQNLQCGGAFLIFVEAERQFQNIFLFSDNLIIRGLYEFLRHLA